MGVERREDNTNPSGNGLWWLNHKEARGSECMTEHEDMQDKEEKKKRVEIYRKIMYHRKYFILTIKQSY